MIDNILLFIVFSNIAQTALLIILFWQLNLKKALFADLFGPFFTGLQISILLKMCIIITYLLRFLGDNLFIFISFGLNLVSSFVYYYTIEKYLSSRNLLRLPAILNSLSILTTFILDKTNSDFADFYSYGNYGMLILIGLIILLPYLFDLILGGTILRKHQERPGLSPTCSWIGLALLFRTIVNILMIFFSSLLYIMFGNTYMENIIFIIISIMFWGMNILAINKIGQITN